MLENMRTGRKSDGECADLKVGMRSYILRELDLKLGAMMRNFYG